MLGLWGNGAAERKFDVRDGGARRKIEEIFELHSRLEGHIVNDAGFLIVKMPVLMKIRAITARFAVEMDLSNDAMLREGLEAVIDRSEGNLWQTIFHREKKVLRRRMNAIFHERFVDFAALAGHAQTIDFRRKIIVFWRIFSIADHVGWRKLAQLFQKSRMILIFITIFSVVGNQRQNAKAQTIRLTP